MDHSPPLVDLHDGASCSVLEAILAGHAQSSAWARVALLSGDTESLPDDLQSSSEEDLANDPEVEGCTDHDELPPHGAVTAFLLLDEALDALASSANYILHYAAAAFNPEHRGANHIGNPMVLEPPGNVLQKVKTIGLLMPPLRPFLTRRVWDPGICVINQEMEGMVCCNKRTVVMIEFV